MAEGPWLGRVTRTDASGRPFVAVAALAGSTEYGPMSRVLGAGGWSGGVTTPVLEVLLRAGDTVLVSAVAGQPSVYVVLGRVV